MATDSFAALWKEKKSVVETWLDRLLPTGDTPPAVLHQAMRHSVFAGGKRLRAILLGAAAEGLGFRDEARFYPMCAFELIHTYSLIHDDLPAMDDDDFRRGVPTCHKVYGEALAILAGDALLTNAFGLLAGLPAVGGSAPEIPSRLVVEAVLAAGTPAGMVAGQVLDVTAPSGPSDELQLKEIHRLKTGALIRGAVRAGAILAGAEEPVLRALTAYAEWLGMAFQVTDDILDVTATLAELGKTPGKDSTQEKLTYPALYGLERSRQLAGEFVENAVASLADVSPQGDFNFLRQTAESILTRRG